MTLAGFGTFKIKMLLEVVLQLKGHVHATHMGCRVYKPATQRRVTKTLDMQP